MDKVKTGSSLAGAIAGFFLGGPVGALVGGGVGYAGGSVWNAKNAPLKTSSSVTLAPGKVTAQVMKGGTLGVMPPQGATVVSLAPSQGSAVTHVSVVSGHGVVAGETSGDVNVLWRAADGSAQATTLSVTVV